MMIVAQLRGVKFHPDETGYYRPKGTRFKHARARAIIDQVLEELLQWLGFDSTESYLSALETQGKKIFKRAKD